MVSTPEPTARSHTALFWAGLAGAVVVLVVFRLHAFDLPLENDECNYAYIGSRLLAGDRLYVDVWDHQPFGVFALFAGVIAVFGDAPIVFRVQALIFSVASLLLIAMILRRVCGRRAAVLGAFLFALASSDPRTGGEGCNREIYMNTLILAAWYFAFRAVLSLPPRAGVRIERARADYPKWVCLSGVALAITSTLKPIVAVHWLFLSLWLLVPQGRDIRGLFRTLLWFAAGPLVVWVASLLYFTATDRLREFVDAVFLANLGYSESGEPFYMRFVRFFRPVRHPFVFESALPLWIAGAIAFCWVLAQKAWNGVRDSSAVIAFLLAGYFATCLSGRFWPHYYYLLVPAAILTVCVVVESIGARPHDVRLVIVLFLVVPVALLGWETQHYLLRPVAEITVKRYNYRDFWGRAQGANVAAVTELGDSVFVFGNDAEIYYYSRRRCASRFTMITGLSANLPGADGHRQTMIRELQANLPRVVLVLFEEKPFREWLEFLEANYGPAVGVDYHDDHPNDPIMFVFARKDQPIRNIDWNWDRQELSNPE